MNASACAARRVLTLLMVLIVLMALPVVHAHAGDSLVIWSPAKVSSHAYRLRLGAKAASAADISAGVDFSVTTSSTGRIRDTHDNARLWAEMRGQGHSDTERSVTAGYNPLTGRVSASAGVTRRWMASNAIDVLVTPQLSAETDGRRGQRGSVRVTQKARLEVLRTGTSFTASSTAVSGSSRIGSEFAAEQRVFERLDLGASVRRQDASLIGALKARLRFDW